MDYMAHYEKSPRLWSQGLHAHDFYEIYVHLEGARSYCVDDVINELQPNQLLMIPPLHMHGLVCDRDLVNYERCYLYLAPEMLRKCGLGKIDLIESIDSAYKKRKILCDLSAENANRCKDNFQKIEKLTASGDRRNLFEIFAQIMQTLQIVEDSLETPSNDTAPNASDNSVMEILHYINAHYTQNITVESISREFNISKSSLAHKFKEYSNKGIYEYILYKRILKAKELLYADYTFTEIAFKCGFNDYSNFLRAFKNNTGLSPRAYLDKMTQNSHR